jgi:Dihaem cytochrome c
VRKYLAAGAAALGLALIGFTVAHTVGAQGRSVAPAEPTAAEKSFKKECGECHMPFPPEMLPARSWRALMGDLAKHFKENASLDAATTKAIADFLVANAADSGRRGADRALRGLAATDVPLRITETPAWLREHRELTPAYMARRGVKLKSNCVACHRGALNGDFDD